jgi:hypothetical protein
VRSEKYSCYLCAGTSSFSEEDSVTDLGYNGHGHALYFILLYHKIMGIGIAFWA